MANECCKDLSTYRTKSGLLNLLLDDNNFTSLESEDINLLNAYVPFALSFSDNNLVDDSEKVNTTLPEFIAPTVWLKTLPLAIKTST